MQLSYPVDTPRISSPFGPRAGHGSSFHNGIDLGWNRAVEPVYAAAPGLVVAVYYSIGVGNVISIRHDDGTGTDYLHLLDRGLVNPGQSVKRRQRIGTMGDTGTASFGRHLHFQYWVNGKRVDPIPYMTTLSGDGSVIEEVKREGVNKMTTIYLAKPPTIVPQADAIFLSNLISSLPINFKASYVIAMCGDSPGTVANVQLTQLDKLGNEWAADHSGEIEDLSIVKGGRVLEWSHFISTLRGYMTPLTNIVVDSTNLQPLLDEMVKLPARVLDDAAKRLVG